MAVLAGLELVVVALVLVGDEGLGHPAMQEEDVKLCRESREHIAKAAELAAAG